MGGNFSNKSPIWSFNKRLGAYNKGVSTGEKWSKEEKHFYINVLKLVALKFAMLTFTKNLWHLAIHVQVDKKVALAYLLKMGGNHSPQFLKISKSIWNYLLPRQVIITAEYLSNRLNFRVDGESRKATDSFHCKLHQKVFLKITKLLGTPAVPPGCVTNFPNIYHGSLIQTGLHQMQCSRTGTKSLVLHSHLPAW